MPKKSKDWRLGMLAAARIAARHARELTSGADARKEELGKMRKAGKNIRSGENGDAFRHHSRLWGYFFDKSLTAKEIARDIRRAALTTPMRSED